MKLLSSALFTFLLLSSPLLAYEMTVNTFDGNSTCLEVKLNSTVTTVKKEIEQLYGIPSEEIRLFFDGKELISSELFMNHKPDVIWAEFLSQNDEDLYTHVKGTERDYWTPLTATERKDIAFIVKILAYKPLTKIWKYKGSLEYAGDRVKHVHPFNFLIAIFGSEELKVGIRNIRKRGWVWSDFFSGLKNSLKEEAARNNLTEKQFEDFARKLGIDADLMFPLIESYSWLEFTDALIENVPREGDTGRYGM